MRGAKDRAAAPHFHALQNTFKILINSFYGYLGFAQGHFADFEAAARVTQIGRDLLKQMIDWLKAQGAQVIEVDTDGIYFVPPSAESRAAQIDSSRDELGERTPARHRGRVRRAIRRHVQLQGEELRAPHERRRSHHQRRRAEIARAGEIPARLPRGNDQAPDGRKTGGDSRPCATTSRKRSASANGRSRC